MFKNSKVEYSPYSANAPMWSDFGSSPNISSDYFEYYHPETETPFASGIPEKIRLKKQADDKSKILKMQNISPTESQEASSNFIDTIDTMNMTPVKVVSPKSKKGQAPVVVKETTVKDVVNDVLAIASSATKPKRKAVNLNKTQGVISESNKIPTVTKTRATRSMQFSDAKKTPVPKVTSIPRRCMAATKVTPSKSNNPVSDSIKNDAGVPLSKIIRTPIFIHKKASTAETKLNSATATNSAATDQASTAKLEKNSLRLSSDLNGDQETDNDVTIKADLSDDPTLFYPLSSVEADDHGNLVSSTPAVKPSSSCRLDKSTPSASKVKSTPIYSKQLKKCTSSPTVPEVVITQSDNLKSSTCPSAASKVTPPKIKSEKSSTSTEPEKTEEENDDDYEDIFEQIEDFEYFHVHKARFVEKRKPARGQQPTVLTSHARRRSSIIKHRRHSNQYVSLAEAVTKFQKGTPTRFHTVSAKNPKPKTLQVVKQQALRPTIPVSPALTSKHRVRHNVVLSRAEIEELEMREIKQHPIRANPVPKTILQAPQPLKVVPKKPLTAQRPFHLSKSKKTIPKNQVSASSISASTVHCKKPVKTVVPSVLNSADGVTIGETEINHFGIPVTQNVQRPGSTKKKTTQPCPFNFEARNKLFMTKKEERLKKLQSEEAQKAKVEFHARPIPSSLKKAPKKESTPQATAPKTAANEKPQEVLKPKVLPFSFEERNKQMLKKKEELRKKIEEEEKKARTFHANPAPHFKPVMVRGRSKESLKGGSKNLGTERNRSVEKKPVLQPHTRVRSAENLTIMRSKSDENMKHSLPRKSSVPQLNDQTDSNQENRAPNQQPIQKTRSASAASGMPALKPKLKPLPVELHSDKRAKMRKEFDEQIKMKCTMEDAKRKREQEERLAREQAQFNEMRKKAEPKARPMPVYKPMVVIKSTKPLTAPESPAWAKSTR